MKIQLHAARNDRVQRMYRKYAGLVRKKCRAYLRDADEAEDAAQEVFVRLLQHFDSIPSDEDIQAFIGTCAANLCRNKLRDAKSHQEKQTLTKWTERTEDGFESKVEAKQIFHRVVHEMEEDHAIAFTRFYRDHVDQGTIARELYVTRRTVINWLNKSSERVVDFVTKCELGEG
jgi:RNA polymerase sigma factor (sigma-70 family)